MEHIASATDPTTDRPNRAPRRRSAALLGLTAALTIAGVSLVTTGTASARTGSLCVLGGARSTALTNTLPGDCRPAGR